MNLDDRTLGVGKLVGPGPSGNPPSGLRAFEIVTLDPPTVGLKRPRGSIAIYANGSAAWIKTGSADTAWTHVGPLGALASSQGQLSNLAAEYDAGGRMLEVVTEYAHVGAAAASKDLIFDPSPYRELRVDLDNLGGTADAYLGLAPDGATNTSDTAPDLRVDSVWTPGASRTTNPYVAYLKGRSGASSSSWTVFLRRDVEGAGWSMFTMGYTRSVTTHVAGTFAGLIAPFASFLRCYGSASSVVRQGSKITVRGVRL